MKTIPTTAVLLNFLTVAVAVFLISCATDDPTTPRTTLVWCGLDYSKVKMIGKDA